MIDKEALAKLIKTFSLEQTDLACRMVILADSRSAPEADKIVAAPSNHFATDKALIEDVCG